MTKNVILILVVVAVIIAGSVFVWRWYEPAGEPSHFFTKEDYKIEEHNDGAYIAIEKIDLTAKVPDGWVAKIEGNDLGYWIEITSADLEGNPVIGQACGISIEVVIDEERNQKVRDDIKFIQENPERVEDLGYDFKAAISGLISSKPGFFWLSQDNDVLMGQANGVNVPLGKEMLFNITASTISGYNAICLPIWQEFLMTIEIE